MKTACAWRAAAATDAGLERNTNEDRVLVDESLGAFLVVDGLGGHAAGELAAETAVQAISESISGGSGGAEHRVRTAITEANNRIYRLAQSNSEWRGMACVLTLALAEEDRVTVGHVGDSRLYLAWNGTLRKLTSDHSLVGEKEEQGELDERDAMRHPRRHEIFRDVGSQLHEPDDPDFIETRTLLFRPEAALLLCSDGLSDALTTNEINSIVERYEGDPELTAQQLVEAANIAGGRDNVSVVFVAGSEFIGSESVALAGSRPRHATTRMRSEHGRWRSVLTRISWLLVGLIIGILALALIDTLGNRDFFQRKQTPTVPGPKRIIADDSDGLGIRAALAKARPGDTVEVPPGQYLGPLQLKEGVDVISSVPGMAVIRSDPAATTDAGIGAIATAAHPGKLQGFVISGDETHPLRIGIDITGSSVEIADTEVSGAIEAGVRIGGNSSPLLLANYIHGNTGPGVLIRDASSPRLVGNRITDNGTVRGALHAGIEEPPDAHPVLKNNEISHNGLPNAGDSAPK
ncbi:MAG: protein phosphatase 2C domain-containing protein [Acidobacteriaceae bacterium]|nr:protein phosphatase 2C domain-containing protein [Acidobacteriaceae bacterium]